MLSGGREGVNQCLTALLIFGRLCFQRVFGMKSVGVFALIISFSIVAESKIYTRCKLAKIFAKAGLDNYGGFALGNCEIPPKPTASLHF